mmetsp:Transcript_21892/g.40806  ORF Transcript_21892/g.40806 Transcript_21892/m.40806 type:complete len:181 (-) Transcript_21892:57-599(-)
MGFDTGLMLANLLFAYFSQPGRKNDEKYSEWILNQTIRLFEEFERKFLLLWNKKEVETSDDSTNAELLRACPAPTSLVSAANKKSYLGEVWKDTLGFAGAELIRRIVGIAHVEDLDGIEDMELRSSCEKRCLWIARHFLCQATNCTYESPGLPLVQRPQDLLQAVETMNCMNINEVTWVQ